MPAYLTDPDDFCRTCRGSGLERDGNTVSQCYDCGGSGRRSIVVTAKCGDAADRVDRPYYANACISAPNSYHACEDLPGHMPDQPHTAPIPMERGTAGTPSDRGLPPPCPRSPFSSETSDWRHVVDVINRTDLARASAELLVLTGFLTTIVYLPLLLAS